MNIKREVTNGALKTPPRGSIEDKSVDPKKPRQPRKRVEKLR